MSTVIYVRQSLDRDGEGAAVGRQLEECRSLAAAHNIVVGREFVDNDVSASKGTRPEFVRLLAAIQAGEVSTIIVWHTDRLYRRVRDLVELVELAEKHALRILTVKAGNLDLNNPTGRMMAQIMGAVARQEVEHKGERQKAANEQRARAGVWQFAGRPYGYERIDGEVRLVEPEAAVLRESINRVIAGESWYSIAKDFKRRGIVAANGRPFSYQNLTLRASNPALAGIRTYLGDVVTEEGNWPPIVDKATWARFQTVVASRRMTQGWSKKIKYLGSGIYRCGKCGDAMGVARDYNHGKSVHDPIYQCKNFDTRRNLASVDAVVEGVILARLDDPDAVSLLIPTEDMAALAAESQEIRSRIDGLAALYAEGILTASAIREQKGKLQTRLDEMQIRINAIEGGTAFSELVTAENVKEFWQENMTIQHKRRILAALLVVTIMPTKRGGTNTFRPEDVAIEWRTTLAGAATHSEGEAL
jgi:site-specific DNA recombinase